MGDEVCEEPLGDQAVSGETPAPSPSPAGPQFPPALPPRVADFGMPAESHDASRNSSRAEKKNEC